MALFPSKRRWALFAFALFIGFTAATTRHEPVEREAPDWMIAPSSVGWAFDFGNFNPAVSLANAGAPKRLHAGLPFWWIYFQYYPDSPARLWLARVNSLYLVADLLMVLALFVVGRLAYLKGQAKKHARAGS